MRVPFGVIRCPRHLSRLLQVAGIRKIVRPRGLQQPEMRKSRDLVPHSHGGRQKAGKLVANTGARSVGAQPKGRSLALGVAEDRTGDRVDRRCWPTGAPAGQLGLFGGMYFPLKVSFSL